MANETVTHIGKVTDVDENGYTIRINSTEKCGDCAIASFCKSNGSEFVKTGLNSCSEKLITGDEVKIEITSTLVWKAILFACALPLLITVGIIALAKLLDATDITAASAGIVSVALYFMIIHRLKLLKNDNYNLKIYRLTN